MERWTIAKIKKSNSNAGWHFFDQQTLKFFRSEILPAVYQGPGGIAFVTSEQFVDNSGTPSPIRYTARRFDPKTSRVHTVGGFNQLNEQEAIQAAKAHALGRED